jgi:hypothetical protein
MLSNSKIKKVVYSGSADEIKALKLDKDTLNRIAPAVRAEYFKKLQG